jgi:hypothetical protein
MPARKPRNDPAQQKQPGESAPQNAPVEPEPNSEQDLLDETIQFWQPYYKDRTLTREDARQIRENIVGFFRVLMEWEARDRAEAAKSGAADVCQA